MAIFKKTSKFTVPHPDDLHPEWADQKRRLVELQQRESDLHSKSYPQRGRRYREGRTVESLIDDAVAGKPFDPGRVRTHEEILAEHRAHHAVVVAAISRLRKEIDASRGEASRKVCDATRAEYLRRAETLVTAVRAAYEAHAALDALKEDLNDLDIQWTGRLPNISANVLFGPIREDDNKTARFLREAAQVGVGPNG